MTRTKRNLRGEDRTANPFAAPGEFQAHLNNSPCFSFIVHHDLDVFGAINARKLVDIPTYLLKSSRMKEDLKHGFQKGTIGAAIAGRTGAARETTLALCKDLGLDPNATIPFASAVRTDQPQEPGQVRRPRVKWSDETRKTKAEGRRNPAQFIRDEFAEELAAGTLTRGSLKALDSETLYRAYATWIGRHPEDDLRLPTRSQVVEARAMSPEYERIRNEARRYEADKQKRYRMSR